jgi:ribosomal protein S18 acetylase RimI-like enzyme
MEGHSRRCSQGQLGLETSYYSTVKFYSYSSNYGGRLTKIEIREEPLSRLADYGHLSIAFTVSSIFDLARQNCDPNTLMNSERRLELPYEKDYDQIPGNKPMDWAANFDISNWGLFSAQVNDKIVGEAIIAYTTDNLILLEGRTDLAVLWDIRISPKCRGRGVGSALLLGCENWAEAKGCKSLKIETQNINVPACKFYAKHGYELSAIHPFAYPELPDEIQLIWQKTLRP